MINDPWVALEEGDLIKVSAPSNPELIYGWVTITRITISHSMAYDRIFATGLWPYDFPEQRSLAFSRDYIMELV